jgi:hypothetical protein
MSPDRAFGNVVQKGDSDVERRSRAKIAPK